MNRIDRLTAILIHLQTKRVVKAQELADRFHISLRTIYRDIRALEEAGVPIGAEAGIGYFLDGYHLPPVMLTKEEASALLLGSKLIEQWTEPAVKNQFESALYKIKSVLTRADQDHLEDLEPHLHIARNTPIPAFSDGLLTTIQQAIVQVLVLEIEYQSFYKGELTRREVEPVGLYQYGTGWHLIAYCRLRQDYRDFRIDRIHHLTTTSQRYSRQNLLTLPAYLDRLRKDQNLEEVVVTLDKHVARYIRDSKYSYGFVSEEDLTDQVRMTFLTQSLTGLGRWLLMLSNAVRIDHPEELKHLMQQLAEEVRQHYL